MSATFVMTPGRCGTQWLHQQLQSGNNHHWICHEPLHFDYAPLDNSPSQPLIKNAGRLVDHLQNIQRFLRAGKNYVECGFPCWRHLDWFRRELGYEVKVIYIHRDPIENAASLLKLNAFVPPILPHQSEKNLFHPLAKDALLPEYANCWQQLSPFEKSLYYWAEVNLQANLFQNLFMPSHWLTIRCGELYSEATLQKIAQFSNISLDFHPRMLERIDRYQGLSQSHVNFTQIHRHPKILAVASRLGYEYRE